MYTDLQYKQQQSHMTHSIIPDFWSVAIDLMYKCSQNNRTKFSFLLVLPVPMNKFVPIKKARRGSMTLKYTHGKPFQLGKLVWLKQPCNSQGELGCP